MLWTLAPAPAATAAWLASLGFDDPEIKVCEQGCRVAASGWPLVFVRDYLGMSVVKTADMLEVWSAADRFDWLAFLGNVAFWTAVLLVLIGRFRTDGNAA